jgi:RNA polymerase sigma factor (sigma-70 family)
MEAEDVLQTVYLKILQGRARFDGRSAFRTWLFAVIRRTAADERRRHWLRRLGLATFTREQATAPAAAAPAKPFEKTERQSLFQTALARLPRRQQDVLHLVFYQDMSIQEAAGIMGVSLGSARTHYERGKSRLRELLSAVEALL